MPVRPATTSAAILRGVPAATSSATARVASAASAPPPAPGSSGAEHQGHLAFRRLGEALGELGGRAAHDLLELLRQLAADRDRRGRREPPPASAASPAAAAATRRRRPARRSARARPRARRARPPGAAGTRRTRSARPTSPLATSAVSTAEGPGSTVTGTPAASAAPHEPRARIGDPGHPGVRDERHPLARGEPRQELGDPRRLVVRVQGEEPRADPVPVEQEPRVPGVLAEDDIGGSRSSSSTRSVTSPRFPIGVAQTASGIAAPLPQRFEGDERRPRSRPRRGPSSATASRTALARRRERLAQHHLARRVEQQRAGRDAEAAADHDDVGVEEVDERGDGGARGGARSRASAGWRCSTRSRAVAAGPSTSRASRSAAWPEQYDSTWPWPVHAPWQGSPSSTITMCPTSDQPR